MKLLLDSSAWLAHLFAEPGAEQVNQLFDDPTTEISISALSLAEVHARLRAIAREQEWAAVWGQYAALFDQVIAVDETIATEVIRLRSLTAERLPLIDGLIAATAIVHDLTLVHRDPHLAAIPSTVLPQIVLPAKV